MNYETLLYEHTEHVVTLTHNRPHQHNLMAPALQSRIWL